MPSTKNQPKIIQIMAVHESIDTQTSILALDCDGNTYILYKGMWVLYISNDKVRD